MALAQLLQPWADECAHYSYEQPCRQLAATRNSGYRNGPLEGVVVRHEDENWLLARGKLVRAEFTQAIDTH